MKKIAIIDDEHDILNLLKGFLSRSRDYEVDIFDNPINGIRAIENGNYDLVLLDIMMPQLDGLEALVKIKEVKPDVQVIMMTAFDTLERTIQAHKKGAKNYLTKPFDSLASVKDKIDKVLR